MTLMDQFIPNCEVVNFPANSTTPLLGRLGVRVSKKGWALPFERTEEKMVQFRSSYGEDWEPVDDKFLYSFWVGGNATLMAGGERAGARPGELSQVCLSLTDKHLIGVFNRGICVDSDDATSLELGESRFLAFAWPLENIETISVEGTKGRLGGYSDKLVMITGAHSIFRTQTAQFHSQGNKYPVPFPDKSDAQALGFAVAKAVNDVRGTTSTWVSSDEKVAGLRVIGHEISFPRA